MAKTMTQAEYARHRGVHRQTVHDALKVGRIVKASDGNIDPEAADLAWERNTKAPGRPRKKKKNARKALEPVPEKAVASVQETLEEAGEEIGDQGEDDFGGLNGAGVTLTDARKAKTIQEAHLARLKVMQMREQLVDREEVNRAVFEIARRERDAWTAWPARVSPLMAADLQIDQRTLHAILEQYVHEHLAELGDIDLSGIA